MVRPLSAFVLISGLASTACGGSTAGAPTSPTGAPSPTIGFEQTVTLRPGERMSAGSDLALQFTGVSNDSRCPGDALCISAGEAVAVFEATVAARGGVRVELSTLELKRAIDVGSYRVELRALDPYPFASLPRIEPGDYRATVRVSSR